MTAGFQPRQHQDMGTRFNAKPVPPGWECIDRWTTWLQAHGLRPATIRVKRQHVMYLARCNPHLRPDDLTVDVVLNWAAKQPWKPETRHGSYGSYASFMTWWRREQGKHETVEFPIVRRPRTLARPVPDALIEGLVSCADDRVALAVRLAAFAGLRRGEIPLVHTTDLIDEDSGRTLLIHGKGGVERLVPVSNRLDSAIRAYRKKHHIEWGWLFPGAINGHISATWIGKLVNSQLPRPWTLHGLRHRFATSVYAATKDIIVVQQLMGHASVATTQRYLAFTSDALRAAVNAADT